MNKKGIEFGFSWIFAIIVGSVILFLALFAVTKFVGTERRVSDTFVAAELNNLLHPIETNLEDSKYVKIGFLDETRVFNECVESGNFGKQQISTSSKLGFGNEWGDRSVRKSSFNKYIFSRETEEGKDLHVIVKPFKLPYKIGDLTFMYSGDYCFVNPVTEIEDEIDDLSAGGEIGIEIVTNPTDCKQGDTIVCFNQIGCDINVNTGSQIVSHENEDVFYEGNLLLGAILSDIGIYECQLKRLMKRNSELARLYSSKALFLEGQGCSNNLGTELITFANSVASFSNSNDLTNVFRDSEDLRRKNDAISRCKVF